MSKVALVVDDSMLIRHTVCRFLEERAYSVESATNGQEALEMLRALKPDVIVTDMEMPKMTGSELIVRLQANKETAKIPVIILSGKKSESKVAPPPTVRFVIYKDIDIEVQLQKALATVMGDKPPSQSN